MSCPIPRALEVRLTRSPATKGLGPPTNTSCSAATTCRRIMGETEESRQGRERMVVLYMNVKLCSIAYDVFTTGMVDQVSVSPLSILRGTLMSGAVGFITAHNHPSGDPMPSEADRRLWAALSEHAKAIEVRHIDDLVIGEGGYFSRMLGFVEPWSVCERNA